MHLIIQLGSCCLTYQAVTIREPECCKESKFFSTCSSPLHIFMYISDNCEINLSVKSFKMDSIRLEIRSQYLYDGKPSKLQWEIFFDYVPVMQVVCHFIIFWLLSFQCYITGED